MGQQTPLLLCFPVALSSRSIVNAPEVPDTTLPSGALSSSQASLIASAQGCWYLCRWESFSIFSDTFSADFEQSHRWVRFSVWISVSCFQVCFWVSTDLHVNIWWSSWWLLCLYFNYLVEIIPWHTVAHSKWQLNGWYIWWDWIPSIQCSGSGI